MIISFGIRGRWRTLYRLQTLYTTDVKILWEGQDVQSRLDRHRRRWVGNQTRSVCSSSSVDIGMSIHSTHYIYQVHQSKRIIIRTFFHQEKKTILSKLKWIRSVERIFIFIFFPVITAYHVFQVDTRNNSTKQIFRFCKVHSYNL